MHIRSGRPDDAPALARVAVDSRRSQFAGVLPGAWLAGMSYSREQAAWQAIMADSGQRDCVLVAEEADGRIVGYGHGGPARAEIPGYSGQIYAVRVLPDIETAGVDRAVFRATWGCLQDRGWKSVMAGALRPDPAVRVFEALNGILLKVDSEEVGGQTLARFWYGWPESRWPDKPDGPSAAPEKSP